MDLTKIQKTLNRNLVQGKENDAVHTVTSYFDRVWNAFLKHTDGSIQWNQIVTIDVTDTWISKVVIDSLKTPPSSSEKCCKKNRDTNYYNGNYYQETTIIEPS